MTRWLLIFLILAGCETSDRPTTRDPNPAEQPAPGSKGVDLTLTADMRRALDSYAPGFTTFSKHEYAAGVENSSQAGGDFNGDGIQDVALYGHDQTRELLLVVLSDGRGRFGIVPLQERKLIPFEHGVFISLMSRPAGPLELPEELKALTDPKPPSHLKYAGIDVTYGNQAGELYYWNGHQFSKVVSGD
jgi:hypothetical protein